MHSPALGCRLAAVGCSGTTSACCSGTCRDLNSDPLHCGSCTALPCSGLNAACCSEKCSDTFSNINSCGACNRTQTNQPAAPEPAPTSSQTITTAADAQSNAPVPVQHAVTGYAQILARISRTVAAARRSHA
ncbi:hypothetical protein N7463_004999 [Penicillium fimorum]|uniref:Uncharacterized protein n=1 Tax=Penicillium fimorum TaxID=1882269 RepID=A0A9W9XT84_9EURO|nr:hypothetical protein N7463_004999 [Penicillium fimorum]